MIKFKILFLDLPESDLFEVEGILDDTRGGDAHTEDVLLRRQEVGLCYSVYVRQVAVRYRWLRLEYYPKITVQIISNCFKHCAS